jgi:hypothetical protein
MGELEKTVAIVFKRKGKSMLSEREFINTLLFDLRWSDPGKSPKIVAVDAQKILDAAVKAGLLTLNEGVLKPSFDYKTIEIPLNFMPSKTVMEEIGGVPKPTQSVMPSPAPSSSIKEENKVETKASQDASPPPIKEDDASSDVPLNVVLIEDIARGTGLSRKELVARINKMQTRLQVAFEVAALIVARDSGMDISKYYAITREEIRKK